MLVDWVTVAAQALNFIVLVWLLKRFLYQPVLDAIDAREHRIEKQIDDATATKRAAEDQRQDFVDKNEAFENERTALLDRAVHAAQNERERLLAAARNDCDALRAKRHDELLNEGRQVRLALREGTRREVFAIARRALADLASTSLEKQLAEVFVRRLEAVDDSVRNELAAALTASDAKAVLRSAFELPQAQRTAIQAELDRTFKLRVTIDFVTAPDLVNGIELIVSGQKLAWSIDQYLEALERDVTAMLDPTVGSRAPAAASAASVTASSAT